MSSIKIPLNLVKKGIFTYTQAISEGLSQYAMEQLVKQELLGRIDRAFIEYPPDLWIMKIFIVKQQ
jgi:hypothetical protein